MCYMLNSINMATFISPVFARGLLISPIWVQLFPQLLQNFHLWIIMSVHRGARLKSFLGVSACRAYQKAPHYALLLPVFSCQALHVISLRGLMPITPSMWPLDGTALQSSCSGTSAVFLTSSRFQLPHWHVPTKAIFMPGLNHQTLKCMVPGLLTGRRWTCGQWAAS